MDKKKKEKKAKKKIKNEDEILSKTINSENGNEENIIDEIEKKLDPEIENNNSIENNKKQKMKKIMFNDNPIYNDMCYPYSSKDGVDMILI